MATAPAAVSSRAFAPSRRPAVTSAPPATPPRVQVPCIVAITGRPSARSTATAWTLSATFRPPNVMPRTTT